MENENKPQLTEAGKILVGGIIGFCIALVAFLLFLIFV